MKPHVILSGAIALAALSAAAQAETIGGLAFSDATRHSTAMAPTDAYTIVGEADLMTMSPMNADGSVRAIVEIPTGTSAKWEVSKDDPRAVYWEFRNDAPRVVNYLGYPGNYGSISGTAVPKELGGDGDPLDIIFSGRPPRVARSSMSV